MLIIPSRKFELEGELKERVKGMSPVSAKSRYFFLFSGTFISWKKIGINVRYYRYVDVHQAERQTLQIMLVHASSFVIGISLPSIMESFTNS